MRIRSISYRVAKIAFVFAGLWFLIGAIVLWSPLPDAMGIAGPMFAAWFVLFFLGLAVAGSLLTIAALNAAFPVRPATSRDQPMPARSPTMWAPPPGSQQAPSRPGSSSRDG